MDRCLIEKIKMVESWRVPLLGKYWYMAASALDRRAFLKQSIPHNPLNTQKRNEVVICSLTSFPARINCVHQAIKSLMLQTYKPDKIQLWLAECQFPNKKLPDNLTDLCRYGLEIGWCNSDMYGHKKYFYPVKNQKENEVVITFDDDIIYSPKTVERLMTTYKKYPNCIVCERAQAFVHGIDNPGKWKTISNTGVKKPSYSLNPSPGGGCLIPYHGFFKDAVIEDKFTKLAYKNDDLWYMFMAAENGTRIIKTRKYHKLFTVVEGSQETQMATENVIGNRNIEIMQILTEAYPNAWRRITTDQD